MEGTSVSKYAARVIATFFGLGYMPVAPGTFGTLGAMSVSYVLSLYILDDRLMTAFHLTAILFFYAAGWWSCLRLQPAWGKDPSCVVVDEAIGYWTALLFIPITATSLIAAFFLFRFFDIVKPLGIRKLDSLSSVHSILLDDLLAGVYSLVLLKLALHLTWI